MLVKAKAGNDWTSSFTMRVGTYRSFSSSAAFTLEGGRVHVIWRVNRIGIFPTTSSTTRCLKIGVFLFEGGWFVTRILIREIRFGMDAAMGFLISLSMRLRVFTTRNVKMWWYQKDDIRLQGIQIRGKWVCITHKMIHGRRGKPYSQTIYCKKEL